jgi:uncharacterized LabA/DUF88 family protein
MFLHTLVSQTPGFGVLRTSSINEDEMAINKRIMLFVDGENLVMRYQSMLAKGYIPLPIENFTRSYRKDIYLWSSDIPFPAFSFRFTGIDIIRGFYYTSVCGDDQKHREIENDIRRFSIGTIASMSLNRTMYPVVFKKRKQSEKAKGVDIRLTIDMLSHTYENNIDCICFFSGDGDFEPVLQEVIRHGKQVFLYSFSDGLNEKLLKVCDEVFILDDKFFNLDKK